ncbi:MAG TPA: glycosyltransferase family 2 protein [Alphaproteobacteria bacterium]|nr:glycosyltransferase family 2 protein [Alphaproteobacteria bacterium]
MESLLQARAEQRSPAASSSEDGTKSPAIHLSVVIPLFNEQESVVSTHEGLRSVLTVLGVRSEILFIDDGSTDQTPARLQDIVAGDKQVRIITLARNFGQTAAIMAGLDHARGEIVAIMDGDGQNDPADIPAMLAKLDEGFDVVSGWRRDRQDSLITRRMPSWIANWLISRLTGVRQRDFGCTLRAYRSWVVRELKLYGEMHRFIPAFASMVGARMVEIPVAHHPRRKGASKYGLERVVKVLLDLMVTLFLRSYLARPIYLFGGFGLFCFLIAGIAGVYALYLKIAEGVSFILTPLPLAVITTGLMGVISILMGLLAETLSRTYFESQGKSPYIVREFVNFEAEGRGRGAERKACAVSPGSQG